MCVRPCSWVPCTLQTLTLLGKLGGRNRRWMKAPQDLPYKEQMEHGMRLIMTFAPDKVFLVPLDKCLKFSLDAIADAAKGASPPLQQLFHPAETLISPTVCESGVSHASHCHPRRGQRIPATGGEVGFIGVHRHVLGCCDPSL